MRQKIDYTDFRALRRLAIAYAKSRGCWQDAEDFAQEYCFAVWLEKNRSLHFQLVNYLKDTYGRIGKWGTLKDIAKHEARKNTISYDVETDRLREKEDLW